MVRRRGCGSVWSSIIFDSIHTTHPCVRAGGISVFLPTTTFQPIVHHSELPTPSFHIPSLLESSACRPPSYNKFPLTLSHILPILQMLANPHKSQPLKPTTMSTHPAHHPLLLLLLLALLRVMSRKHTYTSLSLLLLPLLLLRLLRRRCSARVRHEPVILQRRVVEGRVHRLIRC